MFDRGTILLDKSNFDIHQLRKFEYIKEFHIILMKELINNFDIRIILQFDYILTNNSSIIIEFISNLYKLEKLKLKNNITNDMLYSGSNIDNFLITLIHMLKFIDNEIFFKVRNGMILDKHLPYKFISKKIL